MSNSDSVLSMYLKEINKIPLLSYEEETELAVKAAKGDVAAKNKIINSNLRFVISIAKKYQKKAECRYPVYYANVYKYRKNKA